MEFLYFQLLTLVIGAIGALVILYRRMHYWARKNVPNIPPLPLLGSNISYLIKLTPAPVANLAIYNSFPEARYFGMMSFTKPVAVIRDPEIIKEIMVKSFDNFPDHYSIIDENTDPVVGKNLFALRGQRWKEIRSTLSPSFTASKMKFMFELVSNCSKKFVEYFSNHPEEADCLETKEAFTRYTNDVIATTAFGISVDSMKDKNNEFYIRGKDAISFNVFRLIKFIIFIISPRFMKLIGQKFLSPQTENFFKTVIQDTLNTRKEQKIIRPDMIHLLMEAKDKDNGINLSIDDIIAQAFIFFFAGFDTSSTLMCFLAHELALNPEIQEKLRNEIDSLENKEITYETITKMTYLDMVISEALRKYPPAVATDRVCSDEFILPKATAQSSEYKAEPNTQFFIPIYGLHNDPKYFPEPEKFDPERFSDDNKDKMNPYAYLPFGLGPRKCIGNRFALMETKILFVHILQNFVLEKTEKTKDPIEFDSKFALAIKGGFWVKFRKRVLFY